MNDSKFISLLKDKEFLILDGGFATTLELHGHVLDKKLWSAYTTVQSPLSVVDVHEKFIQSGSDVIITSSYQMSYEGFRAKGYDALQTDGFLRRATACAMAACHNMSPRHTAVVAASVGCYGAHLADGSEYSGCYGLSVAELMSWHQRRFEVLCSSGADAIACETVPSLTECTALRNTIALQVQTMQDGPHSASLSGWLSCSCRSGQLLNSGEPFEDAVRTLCDPPHEVESPPLSRWGIGVNCTSPEYVMDLLDVIQDAGGPGGGRPVVVYPNKGEVWDAQAKQWEDDSGTADEVFAQMAVQWREGGANVIGGCCRTTPKTIFHVAQALRGGGGGHGAAPEHDI